MTHLTAVRSPVITFCQTGVSLLLSAVALLSSYWCVGKQKMPKPLCSLLKTRDCIPVPGMSSNSSSAQFSWETGDDRFVFPSFHSGLWTSCQENIYLDQREEKCRSFMEIMPQSEKAVMLWLSVTMELMYMGLLTTSSLLLCLQLCIRAWLPSAACWGLLLNAFSAIFTVLAGRGGSCHILMDFLMILICPCYNPSRFLTGLLGMVGHMMFMQVFQVAASMGPEDFKPHSYGYSWAFYVAWVAFSLCMSSGVCTLNSYTESVLMHRHACALQQPAKQPMAPFFYPPPPLPVPPLSPLSPYYSTPANVQMTVTHSEDAQSVTMETP
ncbi:germ cell-specific gene 1-like protein [Brienomyrus brachyistius]|uniref:germ cell-specific gene 1-like protein n=1 Tax=Brienomyrus brachyistius TaxID=42636 RepID=UPI0020B2FA18|nr:germ cell-specific gene 1-like protein [Brienomyrus brachyistius]